jgi:hypothetical protein
MRFSMMARPGFIDSPYFEWGEGDEPWRLREGAPEEVRREFEEYMRQREEDERRGVVA